MNMQYLLRYTLEVLKCDQRHTFRTSVAEQHFCTIEIVFRHEDLARLRKINIIHILSSLNKYSLL